MPFDKGSFDGFLHYRLIPILGMPVGELFDLDSLAAAYARDGPLHRLLHGRTAEFPGRLRFHRQRARDPLTARWRSGNAARHWPTVHVRG
jgi:hypothetical protein